MRRNGRGGESAAHNLMEAHVATNRSSASAPSLKRHALGHAAKGFWIFPLAPRKKSPVIPKAEGGRGFQDATTDETQIRRWWDRWPQANIGAEMSARSGRLTIDIDPRNGGSYDQLVAVHGELPPTLAQQTGDGGVHLIFEHPGDDFLDEMPGVPGVDIKANGYIVLAPSVHPNGNRYAPLGERTLPAKLPDSYLALMRKPDKPEPAQMEPSPIRKGVRREAREVDKAEHWLRKAVAQAGEGSRNNTGFWLACQLRDDEVSESEAEVTMRAYARMVPGSDYDEGEALNSLRQAYGAPAREPARNLAAPLIPFPTKPAAKKPATVTDPGAGYDAGEPEPPTQEDEPRRKYHRTEMGNAERLFDAHGPNFRYAKAFGYCVWDGRRWRQGTELTVEGWAKQVIRGIFAEAAELASDAGTVEDADQREGAAKEASSLMKWALDSEKDKMVKAMLSLNRSSSEIGPEAFDADPWLLNCANGTIDLKTGRLRPHERADYLMQMSPVAYDPAAQCPRFERFLDEVMCGDKEMIAYVQRVLGYCLTGKVSEQVWHLMVGEGENGKGTLMETFARVLGDYAHMMSPDTITMTGQPRRGGEASPDLAALKGKRFVRVTETTEGARVDAARIKTLSGGDKVVARFLHKDPFEFFPTFKIFIYTNHEPETRETTHAFWRRVRYLPFRLNLRRRPDLKDPDLEEKLGRELPGILAWAVRGCLDWQRDGLNPPTSVLEATNAYRAESDVLQGFIESRCTLGKDFKARASALYEQYEEWCEETNERPIKFRLFSKALRERGFNSVKASTIWYEGIGLRSDYPDSDDGRTGGTGPNSGKSSYENSSREGFTRIQSHDSHSPTTGTIFEYEIGGEG